MQYSFKEIYPFYRAAIAIGEDDKIYGTGFNCGILNSSFFDYVETRGYKKVDNHVQSDNLKVFDTDGASTFFIKKDNPSTLWGFGKNNYGELGLSQEYTCLYDIMEIPFPESAENIIKIKTAKYVSVILTNTNNLYMTGYNKHGVFGMGNFNDYHYGFILIAENVLDFYTDCHSQNIYIKKTDGTYWGTGWNASNPVNEGCPLGLGNTTAYNSFTQLPINDVAKFIVGQQEIFYINNNNELFGCGRNNLYQLGLNDVNVRLNFVKLQTDVVDCLSSYNFTFIEKADGTYLGAGYNAANLLAAATHSNYVKTWTKASFDKTTVKQIHFVSDKVILAKVDGTYWGAGDNAYGCLDPENESEDLVIKEFVELSIPKVKKLFPIDIRGTLFFEDEDGHVYQSGYCIEIGSLYIIKNRYRTFTNILPDKNPEWLIPSKGSENVYYLDNDTHILYGLGSGSNAQFGKGFYSFSKLKELATNVKRVWGSEEWTIYEDLNNDLYIAGCDYGGIAGIGETENVTPDSFVKMGISNIEELFYPPYFAYNAFAIKDGELWAAGYNTYGELGLGHNNSNPTWTNTGITNVKKVFNDSAWFTYILKNDGTLWNAGESYKGCLGTSSTAMRTTFTKVMDNVQDCLVTDCYNVYILKEDGTVMATGQNAKGSIGFDHANPVTSFTTLTDNVKKMYGYSAYVFFIKNDNTLWACGVNESGQLGVDTAQNIPITQIPVSFDVSKIKDIKMTDGDRITYILLNDNTCYFAGSNIFGESGCNLLQAGKEGKIFERFTPYLSFEDCAIKGTEIIINKEHVILQDASAGTNHEAILVSHEVLADDKYIYVRGKNDYGQLGLGDNKTRYEYEKMPFVNPKQVSCGDNHTLILNANGELFVTGKNSEGQLGLSDSNDRNIFIKNDSVENIERIKAIDNFSVIELKDTNEILHTDPRTDLGFKPYVKNN